MTRQATEKERLIGCWSLSASGGICLLIGMLLAAGCDRHPAVGDVSAQTLPETGDSRGMQAGAACQTSKLRVYELRVSDSDLMALGNQSFANEPRPATFTFEGKKYPGVKVRIRGSWSRSWPKKSLKILFDHNTPFEGHHSLNLNSGWRDPAFLREPLAYHVYGACGVPAPQSRMVRLDVNGKFGGVYVEVEQPDKALLGRVGLPGASIYKAISRGRDADERDLGSDEAYHAGYAKETKKTEGYSELEQFCRDLQNTSNVAEFFAQRVDLDRYINYLAATVLIQHWDGFNKNHLLIYDGGASKKWLMIPWDLDRTFGDHWNWSFDEARLPVLLGTRRLPGITGWNRVEERFFSEPTLKARFVQRLSALLDQEFTEAKLFPVLDQMEMEITPDAQKDRQKWPGSTPDFHEGIKQVKIFIKQRRAFLSGEIEKLGGHTTSERRL